MGGWREAQHRVRIIRAEEFFHVHIRGGQEGASLAFASPQDVDIVVESKQVEEALGCGLGAEVVHLVRIAAQAAEDMLSRVAGDGHRPAFGQEHPLLLRTRQPV